MGSNPSTLLFIMDFPTVAFNLSTAEELLHHTPEAFRNFSSSFSAVWKKRKIYISFLETLIMNTNNWTVSPLFGICLFCYSGSSGIEANKSTSRKFLEENLVLWYLHARELSVLMLRQIRAHNSTKVKSPSFHHGLSRQPFTWQLLVKTKSKHNFWIPLLTNQKCQKRYHLFEITVFKLSSLKISSRIPAKPLCFRKTIRLPKEDVIFFLSLGILRLKKSQQSADNFDKTHLKSDLFPPIPGCFYLQMSQSEKCNWSWTFHKKPFIFLFISDS